MFGSFFGAIALFASFIEGHTRAVLARVLPPQLFVFIYSASRSLYLKALGGGRFGPHDGCYHKTKAMGLVFRNDLANAAGLDKDASLLEFAYRLGAGYAVVGTVLSEPHGGNVFSMLGGLWSCNVWTPLPGSGAALNSLGLPSKGVDAALANIAAFRERHGIAPQQPSSRNRGAGSGSGSGDFPIGVSIMGHPAHGADAGKKLQGVLDCVRKSLPLADFIEINESCPNVDHGGGGGKDDQGDDDGAHSGQDEELAARLRAIVGVRDAAAAGDGRRVPLLVKLGDLGASAGATVRFLAGLGIDGLVALNTQKDYAAFDGALPPADRALLAHYTARYGGGLSGPPIFARSTAQVAAAAAAVAEQGLGDTFTVIHVGGVQSEQDVRESRATGAPLRQWYTGLMHAIATLPTDQVYGKIAASN